MARPGVMMKRFVLFFILCTTVQLSVQAQETAVTPEMWSRLAELEAQTVSLRQELADLKGEPISHAEMNLEIQKEIKKNAWRSNEVRAVPYGMVWASMIFADSQTHPDDCVSWIMPDGAYGNNMCALTARRSRVGVWLDGPELGFWGGVKTSGKVEIDFMGGINPTHNKPGILLREVYMKMENDCFQFLVGQTKDVISPLDPHTLNYMLARNAGNLGYFHPQFRFERYHYLSCHTKMEVQLALVDLSGDDLPTIDMNPGFPSVQGRLGWVVERDWNPYPVSFGVSGHYGKQRYAPIGGEWDITTWSMNFDLKIPVTACFGFQGEVFYGQGLAGVCGGVEQSFDYSSARGGIGSRKSIHSVGGWGEFWWDITGQLHLAAGYGIDDPRDADMIACTRLSNSVIFTNLVYDFSDFLRTGIEYSYWNTRYRGGDHGTASVVEWMWQLRF